MFTIITPVLNGMPYLPDAVHSLAKESETTPIQHIIMDGGSTDGTIEWLKDNQDLGFEICLDSDNSQSEALRNGFTKAHGQFMGWLNADDILEPGAIIKVKTAFLEQRDCVAVSGAALVINEHNHIIGSTRELPDGDLNSLLTRLQNIPQPSTFFRRDIYERTPGIDLSLHYAMDVDLWLKLAKHGPVHVLKNDILSRVRIHSDAKTVKNQDATAREDLKVRLRHGMRWAPRTTLHLSKRAFAYPLLRPLQRVIQKMISRAASKGPRS